MDNLSYTEAHILSVLSALKGDLDIDNITTLMLGIEGLQEENRLRLVLTKLKKLKLLEIEKIKLFDMFLVNNATINRNIDYFKNGFGTKKDVSIAHKKLISSFKINKKKHSKYEIRFFWSSNLYPELYDLGGLIFNKKYYTYNLETDKYIVTNNKCNVKIRENELQIKGCVKTINNISQFTKKKRIPFPLKANELQDILQPNLLSDGVVFETPEDLITNLSYFSDTTCVDVTKERYVRKMEGHIKIEMSLIKIQQKEWKTICFESKSIQKVLALSLLINQENAEKLTYDEFLHKYGVVDLSIHHAK